MSDCLQIQNLLNSLFDLQRLYLETILGIDEIKGYKDSDNKQKLDNSLLLMEKIQLAIQEIGNFLHVSLEQAQEIMDKGGERNFMGPDQVTKAFPIEVKDIPKITFSKKELFRRF